MKKAALFGFCLILAASAAFAQEFSLSDFAGTWKEYWTDADGTMLNYNDEYIFRPSGGSLRITCTTSDSYKITDIVVDGSMLTFTLIANYSSSNPYTSRYVLTMWTDGSELYGYVHTQDGGVSIIKLTHESGSTSGSAVNDNS